MIDFTDIAYKAGKANRTLGRPYTSNPYPEHNPRCEEQRAAWYRGWIDQDTEIWLARSAQAD